MFCFFLSLQARNSFITLAVSRCVTQFWRLPASGAVPQSAERGDTNGASCRLRYPNAAARRQRRLPPHSLPPHCRTAMADSASESDTDGAGSSSATPMSSSSASNSSKPSIVISQFRLEELTNRLASLQQENKVLKIELETFKLKCKALQEENRDLRKASVTIVSNVSVLAAELGGCTHTPLALLHMSLC